jgi:hypothetical protein
MCRASGIALALALVAGAAADARAQAGYPYSRPYRFSDEPLMSINRSYLGYSNFVYPGPGLPAHANPPPRGGYVNPAPATRPPAYPVYQVPARPRRWLGWWRGYR